MATTKAQVHVIQASSLGRALDGFAYPATLTNNHDRLVYVNEAFCRFYGYRFEEVIGLSPRILLPPGFPEKRLRTIKQRTRNPDGGWDGTLANHRKGRERIMVHLRTFRIAPAGHEAPLYYLGIACPASQMRLAEFALISLLASGLVEVSAPPATPPSPVCPPRTRQEEAVRLRALGYATKEIATIMGISPDTVNVALWRYKQRGRPKGRR